MIKSGIMIKKKSSKDKVGKVKDLSKHPFFVKKAEEAAAFPKKNGVPSTTKK